MSRCLLDRMAATVDAHFRADRALVDYPSPETFAVAKHTFEEYRAAQHQEYQSMVEDGDWAQYDCDVVLRWTNDCGVAYEAWLTSVEEDLQNPQTTTEAAPSAIVIQPAITPSVLLVPETRRDRAFF